MVSPHVDTPRNWRCHYSVSHISLRRHVVSIFIRMGHCSRSSRPLKKTARFPFFCVLISSAFIYKTTNKNRGRIFAFIVCQWNEIRVSVAIKYLGRSRTKYGAINGSTPKIPFNRSSEWRVHGHIFNCAVSIVIVSYFFPTILSNVKYTKSNSNGDRLPDYYLISKSKGACE